MALGSSAAFTPAEFKPRDRALSEAEVIAKIPRPRPLTVVIAVPTIEIGAADEGAVELAGILSAGGHHPIVVSSGGRLEEQLAHAGIEFIRMNMASRNPVVILSNAMRLRRLIRQHKCDIVHVHGRSAAWSGFLAAQVAGVPFLTSWYKGFRDQNVLKHFYNSVMARGDRVITGSEQIARLIAMRYHAAAERIAIVPTSIDFDCFDPAAMTLERMAAVRTSWGAKPNANVILVAGRMLRRKGHHVVVQAARRLKEMGLKDFLFVFAGEDHGRTRYTGELWDLVLSTHTADVVRMAGTIADLPAAYAAATGVVSAAIQAEGAQRSILESLAMARPVIVSDLAAGPEIIQAPPAVSEDRMTGLRFPAGDAEALAAAVIRLMAMPEALRGAMGRRGRDWVLNHCQPAKVSAQILALYETIAPAIAENR